MAAAVPCSSSPLPPTSTQASTALGEVERTPRPPRRATPHPGEPIEHPARAFFFAQRARTPMRKTPRYDQGNTHDPRNPDTDDPAALRRAEDAIQKAQTKDDAKA